MRVPVEPAGIPIIRRRTVGGRGPDRETTYQEEMDARRRQEREDEVLARRMQLEADFGVEGRRIPFRHVAAPAAVPTRPRDARARRQAALNETFEVGNNAGHFLNDDFVRTAANAVLGAFDEGTSGLGRRGERASVRRPSAAVQAGHAPLADPGLAPDAFGDSSILGAANVAGLRTGSGSGSVKKKRASFTRIAKNGGVAQGGKSDRIRGWLANVE
ncbi:3-oxoacyl [Sphaceloma murrayae]|uniref:3-oxoacyl n=1 Tax=Sphaceloma murrayae TaxID=2082308 RepID=A0A2K1QKX6_9PEZI|nr:3-oxoacyl [Sphaceloma murrayae]